MDEQRALLDELMGISRDGTRQEVKRKFSDPEVCKYFLQGFCFMEEFQRTKHHYGDCDKVHDEECKAAWEALDEKEKELYPYERELWDWLEKMMSDLRAKVRRNEERINQTTAPVLSAAEQSKFAEMDAQVKALISKSEELGEQGDVDAAQAAATQAERLKAERKLAEEEAIKRAQDALNRYGEQQVCKFSGVIINSEESRLRDHKAGRNYRAWVRAHEKKKELEETFKRRGTSIKAPSSRPRESGRDRDGDRERDKEGEGKRSNSRTGERSRDRRDSDRDRDRHRDKERDRHHRSSDRDRSSKRYHRSRSRDRDQERRPRDSYMELPPPPGPAPQ